MWLMLASLRHFWPRVRWCFPGRLSPRAGRHRLREFDRRSSLLGACTGCSAAAELLKLGEQADLRALIDQARKGVYGAISWPDSDFWRPDEPRLTLK